MSNHLKPEQIDRMADGFVGIGSHRSVPVFGFDPETQMSTRSTFGLKSDDVPPGRSAGIGKPVESPAQTGEVLPGPLEAVLGDGFNL